MKDEVSRAYATLGLPFGASPPQIKRRYRALVRTWHPDRFASDPIGQAAATERLAHVNRAYRLLLAARPPDSDTAAAGPVADPREGGSPESRAHSWSSGRLGRDEIDAIARAIGTESPIEWVLGRLEWVLWPMDAALGRTPSPRFLAIGLVCLVIAILVDSRLDTSVSYPLMLTLVVVALVWSRWKEPR